MDALYWRSKLKFVNPDVSFTRCVRPSWPKWWTAPPLPYFRPISDPRLAHTCIWNTVDALMKVVVWCISFLTDLTQGLQLRGGLQLRPGGGGIVYLLCEVPLGRSTMW